VVVLLFSPFFNIMALFSIPYAALIGVACALYFLLYPILVYFKDTKGKSIASGMPQR
jgi:hypothetical protein